MSEPRFKLIVGDFLSPVHDTHCKVLRSGAMVLEKKGAGYVIIELGKRKALEGRYKKKRSIEYIDCEGQILLPSFFDMHFHWVQDAVCQMPKDSLLTWLEQYTWPYEATFQDVSVSRKRAKAMKQTLLEAGTLGGMIYASIHAHTVAHALNSFIGDYYAGNVAMTINSPEYLTQTKSDVLRISRQGYRRFGNRYVATPRFAPSTDPETMKALATLQLQHAGFMQTHLSETKQEIRWVLSLYKDLDGFRDIESYLDVYERCGLVGPNSIFGHGIYLQDSEWKLLKRRRAAIAHCPTSNAPKRQQGLGSGLFDFQRADAEGVRWLLATDIGAGPYLSMIDVMRSFVKQNHRRKRYTASYVRALSRSTIQSARFLGIADRCGRLSKGKEANFLVMPSVPEKKSETAESILQHLFEAQVRRREDCMTLVRETWHQGRQHFVR